MIHLLLSYGANTTLVDSSGKTPLTLARSGEVVDALCNPELKPPNPKHYRDFSSKNSIEKWLKGNNKEQ
jgi:hypothetical protein